MKLKKSQIFSIVAFSVAAVLLTAVLLIGLNAEPLAAAEADSPRPYENTQDLDPEESGIHSIDIDWRDGPVSMGYSSDGKIHLTERSRKKIGGEDRMEIQAKGGTLTVRWDGRWFRKWFNVGWFGPTDKELEVLVPKDLAGSLDVLDVSNVSGAVELAGFGADSLEASSVSGKLCLADCAAAQELSASTVSGDIYLDNTSGTEKMSVSTVSGGIEVQKGSSQKLRLNTVSGSCLFDGGAEDLSCTSVSGSVKVRLDQCPEEAELESVSGGLSLELPLNAAFTATHDSLSGSFFCDFPTEDLGGGKVRCGTGGGRIYMSTTSGDMRIEKRA